MRQEKIKLILAQDHSDEEAAGMTGIQQASMYRNQMKKQYEIDKIADGIERAEMRKEHKKIFKF
jgi:hypothetical protein